MNQTALASLISQCVLQLLERNLDTRKNATEQKEPQYKPYDNAYFFILFVMLFYSFLALTVFFGYVRSKKAISKKDPYQEFIEDRNRNKKWNMTRPVVVKFDFEEESFGFAGKRQLVKAPELSCIWKTSFPFTCLQEVEGEQSVFKQLSSAQTEIGGLSEPSGTAYVALLSPQPIKPEQPVVFCHWKTSPRITKLIAKNCLTLLTVVCGCVSVLCAASMGSKGVQGHVACSVPGVDSHTCKDSEVQAQVQPMCTCPMAGNSIILQGSRGCEKANKIGPSESFMNIFQLVPRGKNDDENSFPEAKMF
ncbi:hypothetical protein Q9966_005412 [Columba livia]|nr:hypothetical protein Q9966_005412 [Columba livia]